VSRALPGSLDRELIAVADGGLAGCGHTCDCHGNLVCARAVHPDEPDNRTPHIAVADNGARVQWTGPCPPEYQDANGNPMSVEELADAALPLMERRTAKSARTGKIG